MGDCDVMEHRMKALEERVGAHGREIDKMQECITRLTVLEERSDKRGGQVFAAALSVGAAVVAAVLLACAGLS